MKHSRQFISCFIGLYVILFSFLFPAYAKNGQALGRYQDPVQGTDINVANEHLVFHTVAGDLMFALFPSVAPKHVAQMIQMVRAGLYNTTHFVRVIPGYVLQVSSIQERLTPLSASQASKVGKLAAEFSHYHHKRGVLSMARNLNDEGSAESSFSIILGAAPHLDGKFTVFGVLEDGWSVLEVLEKASLNGESPLQRLTVINAEVVSKLELTTREWADAVPLPLPSQALPIQAMSKTNIVVGPTTEGQTLRILIPSLVLVFLICFLTFLFRKRLTVAKIASFVLVILLIIGFNLLIVLLPKSQQITWLPLLICLGFFATFKIMGQFE